MSLNDLVSHGQSDTRSFHVKSAGRSAADELPEYVALLLREYARSLILNRDSSQPVAGSTDTLTVDIPEST